MVGALSTCLFQKQLLVLIQCDIVIVVNEAFIAAMSTIGGGAASHVRT